ncbi:hypothetical protein [Desulfosarcina sp.]|jgi:hypothetical protein|uniref:hypothetical protein n=1 Tax=Desulfosarcina sp. TaxID=2027861 RepID=UPI0039706D73
MDIVVIGSAFVQNEEPKHRQPRLPAKNVGFVEKRRSRTDRRKSVREGVVVSLSHQIDRRTRPDRRQNGTD